MKKVKDFLSYLCFLILLAVAGCEEANLLKAEQIKKNIIMVLQAQVNAWNAGNIENYMAGYYNSDSLRFASGGTVSYGWETTLERYKKGYPDKSAMGHLSFSGIDIKVISAETALVFGSWKLEREDRSILSGLFTLIFQNTDLGWKIIHDHTSLKTN